MPDISQYVIADLIRNRIRRYLFVAFIRISHRIQIFISQICSWSAGPRLSSSVSSFLNDGSIRSFVSRQKKTKIQGLYPLGYLIELSAEGLKLALLKQQSFFFATISIELNAVGPSQSGCASNPS